MANELQTRNTVFAIKEEVTQNTLVVPTAATDFIPILDDISVTPAFDTIESTEIQASIGKTKSTKGFENPTANVSLYWKGSSVEGQAPNWGSLLQGLLGGKSTAAAEYDTIAGSTTSVIKVNVGEGASYEKGESLLIKDSVNNYSIRNIASILNDDITLAQNLSNAPASGVNLGKAILYKAANSGHPSLSMWDYRANGGLLQVMGGSRPVSLSASIEAGGAIQATFTCEGVEYFYDPMIVTASNKWLDVNEGGPEINVSITEKAYKDPYELASAIQTALDSACAATIVCNYDDSTRKFTITSNGATFQILFKTGIHGSDNTDTHIGTLLGYTDSADKTLALTYTSDNSVSFAASFTPSFDQTDINIAKDNQVLLGLGTEVSCFRASALTLNISNTHTKIGDICATSGRSSSLFTGRDVSVDVTFYLTTGQAKEFKRFRANDEVIFTFNFGKKSGGNWTPGTCWNIHIPTAVISSFEIADQDSLVICNMTLTAFVKDGNPEIYINQL
ncbi:MAG: hypothetical protein ACP5N7_01740 [Candidatus Pacearchaeota archaeon]